MNEAIVIDEKWHTRRVAMHREWIAHNNEQIEWHKKMIAGLTEHGNSLTEWLEDAIADQKKFEQATS